MIFLEVHVRLVNKYLKLLEKTAQVFYQLSVRQPDIDKVRFREGMIQGHEGGLSFRGFRILNSVPRA